MGFTIMNCQSTIYAKKWAGSLLKVGLARIGEELEDERLQLTTFNPAVPHWELAVNVCHRCWTGSPAHVARSRCACWEHERPVGYFRGPCRRTSLAASTAGTFHAFSPCLSARYSLCPCF